MEEKGLMAVIIVAARRPCPLSLSLILHVHTHTHTQNLFSISSTLVYTLSIGFWFSPWDTNRPFFFFRKEDQQNSLSLSPPSLNIFDGKLTIFLVYPEVFRIFWENIRMLDKFECFSRLPFALSLFLRLGENSFFRRCLFSLFFSLSTTSSKPKKTKV